MTLSITAPSPALTGQARNAEGDPLSAPAGDVDTRPLVCDAREMTSVTLT